MWNGKMKAVTFSYDDGVTQDIRLVKLFNQYGLKATFNLNSGCFGQKSTLPSAGGEVRHDKIDPEQVKELYSGHEVAVHTRTHADLRKLSDEEILHEVEDDRHALEALVGYDIVGMAYPYGTWNEHVVELLRTKTPIRYARTIERQNDFHPQTDLLLFRPQVYHMKMDYMFELADRFLESEADSPQMFYVWGHAYELDVGDRWARFEEFLQKISGHDDIFYGTNREILLPED